jgi:hypothetical protein
MGFDVYGLKPHNPKNLVKPEINWSAKPTDEEKEEFFAALENYEKNVPGHYFRNNVWWWRPLWDYIDNHTEVLSDTQMEEGSSNSGATISEEESIELSLALHKLIDSGHTKKYEDIHMLEFNLAQEHNEELEKQRKKVHVRVVEVTGNEGIAPKDYPAPYKKEWDDLWARKAWAGSYPFSENNIKEFADFCYQSGGFEIW